MSLERIIGRTSSSNASFISVGTDRIAYAAGCTAVVENICNGAQHFFVCSNNEKPITSIAATSDGRYLAVGQRGKDPQVLVFDVLTGDVISQLAAHRFGVVALAFSPSGRALVSVGRFA